MPLRLDDEVQTVALLLVGTVLQDDKRHGDHHEDAEDEHRRGHAQVELDEQRVDAEHDENREVLVEVLDGNRAAGAHEDVSAVLQESVHRNDEKAGADSDGNHDHGSDERRPGDREGAELKSAFGSEVFREVGRSRDEHAHDDAHGKDGEALFERHARCREHGAEYILIDQDYSVDF